MGLNILDEKPAAPAVVPVSTSAERIVPSGATFSGRVAVVTLGCAKNHVDSEVMLGALNGAGFEVVSDVARADVAIVNTCGFLQSAVKEGIDCVLDIAEHKKSGTLRSLIVAGCAVERYREELQRSLPEVDLFVTTDDLMKVGELARSQLKGPSVEAGSDSVISLLNRSGRPYFLYDETSPRILATAGHTAYVKIGEGCNRPCTFCIIPQIRGAMRSRSIDSVRREVEALGAQGVREINLVAQDLTSYGSDRDGNENLVKLLSALNSDGAVDWIRVLYAYPVGIDDELLGAIVDLPRVVEYLDLPLQHVSERVLKDMKRPLGKLSPRELARKIRENYPGIALRTTFIVGFPGETEAEASELADFVQEGWFSSVGVFCYSLEQGTPSFEYSGHISEKEKNKRRAKVMRAQQTVVSKRLNAKIGETVQVLIEGAHEESETLLAGRMRVQAPDVDGVVIINDASADLQNSLAMDGAAENLRGKIAAVTVTETLGYDVVGTLVGQLT